MSWGLLLSSVSASAISIPTSGDYRTAASFRMDFSGPTDLSTSNIDVQVLGPTTTRTVLSIFGLSSYTPTSSNSCLLLDQLSPIGTEDFTIEFTFRNNGTPSPGGLFGRYGPAGSRSFRCYFFSSRVYFEYSTDGTNIVQAAFNCIDDGVSVGTLFNGASHHIAITRLSGKITVWVDGFKGGVEPTEAGAVFTGGSSSYYLAACGGASSNTPSYVMSNAVFDGFRFTLGTARYTAAFTPPSTSLPTDSLGDTYWSQVKCLLSFEGHWPVQAGGFVAPATITTYTSEGFFPYFTKRGLSGVSGRVYPSASFIPDFNLGSSDFTVEAVKVFKSGVALGPASSIICGCWGGVGQLSWAIGLNASSHICFLWSTDGTTVNTLSSGVSGAADTNYTIAVTRSGTTLNLYINGSLITTTTTTDTIYNPTSNTTPLGILAGITTAGANYNQMYEKTYIGGVRINKGLARYTGSAYVVPALPFPDEAVTFSPTDRNAVTRLSEYNLLGASAGGAGWVGGRATLGRDTGKYYFEMAFDYFTGSFVAGGLITAGHSINSYPGSGAAGFGWINNGTRFNNGSSTANNNTSWVNGDRLCVAVDLDARKVWTRKNNTAWNITPGGSQDPAAGTGGTAFVASMTGLIYPSFGVQLATDKVRAKFHPDYMLHPIPSGYTAWGIV